MDDATDTVIRALLREAATQRASDIHLEPTETGGRIRLRVDGVLRLADVRPESFPNLIDGFKTLAALDLEERSLPQDGRIRLELEGRRFDLRLSTLPTAHGEQVVMRILDKDAMLLELDQAMPVPEERAAAERLADLPNGLVVVNGPTGCGKTTLLYCLLQRINRPGNAVFTVEDPIEYALDGIAQAQIRPTVGLTFSRLVRSILRQDPDAIMLAEIRDLETLNVCTQAALTGHLVLSTLHADTSPGALRRLLDIGLPPFLVNSTVRGVISMRLVRTVCPDCAEEVEIRERDLPPEALPLLRKLEAPAFRRGRGCEACHGSGYRGRMAVYEILEPDEAVQAEVHRQAGTAAIRDAAVRGGMRSLAQAGILAAARGETTIAEVLRVLPLDALN